MEPLVTAIGYIRVSTEAQSDKDTPHIQREAIERFCEQHGYRLIGIKEDVITGESPFASRKAGSEILEIIRDGAAQVVVASYVRRLGRKLSEIVSAWAQIEEAGAWFVSAHEGEFRTPEQRLVFSIHAGIAEQEKAYNLRQCREGLINLAKTGAYTGGPIRYGYRVDGGKDQSFYVQEDRPLKELLPAEVSETLTVDWTPGDVVRQMYDWVTIERLGAHKISKRLTKELGIPAPSVGKYQYKEAKKNHWASRTVLGILHDPIYRGVYTYKPKPQKGATEIDSDTEPIVREVPSLRIVSDEQWYAAQAILSENIKRSARNNTTHQYLLAGGYIQCDCGNRTHYSGYPKKNKNGSYTLYYRCASQSIANSECRSRLIRVEDLDSLVWSDIVGILLDYHATATALDRNVSDAAAAAKIRERLFQMEAQERKALESINRWNELYAEGEVKREKRDEKVTSIKASLNELKEQIRFMRAQVEDSNQTAAQVASARKSLRDWCSRLTEHVPDALRPELERLVSREAVPDRQAQEAISKDREMGEALAAWYALGEPSTGPDISIVDAEPGTFAFMLREAMDAVPFETRRELVRTFLDRVEVRNVYLEEGDAEPIGREVKRVYRFGVGFTQHSPCPTCGNTYHDSRLSISFVTHIPETGRGSWWKR